MKPRRLLGALLLLALLTTMAGTAMACTPMAAGRLATVDGSVLVAHTCDGWYDNRVKVVPGGVHEPGEMIEIFVDLCQDNQPARPLRKTGEIPQVEQTNTYFHIGYPFMNDKQVMMGEHTWSGREEMYSPEGMMYIANIEMLGLQRASTARDAVLVMGELAEKYGYGDGGESVLVGDPNEVWVFEICGGGALWTPDSGAPGAHWAAVRLPDDEFYVAANRSRIGVIDFDDPDNYLWSTDITKLPEQMGWWKPGEPFSYRAMFHPEPFGPAFIYSRREWRAFSLVAPSREFPIYDSFEHYPFSIKPEKKLSVQDFMAIYCDHLEGTPYDLTTDLASAPYGNPNRSRLSGAMKPQGTERVDWERAIAVSRCSYSFVSQSRAWLPDPIGGVLWFGEDSPDTTVHVPIYCGVTELPEPWSRGVRHEFDANSAWWAFNLVNNWTQTCWNTIYPEVIAKRDAYENAFFEAQPVLEAKALALYNVDPEFAVYYLTEKTKENMNLVEQGWWDFAWHLLGKYYDSGMINENKAFSNIGYPMDWLVRVEYGQEALRDLERIYGK